MGRWSRRLARVFVEWLHPRPLAHWLDVGCGTGALTSAICELGEPASVVACDPSAPFVDHARSRLSDARASALTWRGRSTKCYPCPGLICYSCPRPLSPGGIVAAQVEAAPMEISTDFAHFDDYWTPFLSGTGPAPGYVMSLDPAGRERLRERLRLRLHAGSDGRIALRARAWAVRGFPSSTP